MIGIKDGQLHCYWYRADDTSKPPYDHLYIRNQNFYGFLNEPSYEIIEKHDLRFVVFGTFEDVCDNYF